MSTYKGKPTVVNRPVADIYSRFSNLSSLRETYENNPNLNRADAQVKFGDDYLSVTNPQLGEIKFEIVERREPSRVAFKAANFPMPLGMVINLKPITEDSTEISTDIDIELPAMVKMMLGSKIQEVADNFGKLMTGMNA